jgi:hypothetical protein
MLMMCLGLFSQVPTRERFTEVCDSLRIHHPNVVYAQARLESGNFKHPYYKRTKNCLGIYDSKKKCYKTFNSWIECLKSYRDEVQYRCKNIGGTDDDYLDWLISIGYASDTLYRPKVKQILKEKK